MPLLISLKKTFIASRTWAGRVRNSTITRNVVALSGTQIAAYAFPLAMIPYLARTLGPFYWGLVALAQAFGVYVSIVVEFGFQLSATRQVARLHDNRSQLAQLLADVMGAKMVLAAICLAAILVFQRFIPHFHEHRLILWAGVASGLGQGFSMLWFFQGVERMRTSAAVDVVGKAIATGGVFVFVHGPTDAWKVLALQCFCSFGTSLVLLGLAYRDVQFRWPALTTTRNAMRESAAMFLFRSAVSLYTTANALILGAVATPAAVGFYSGADKLTRAPLSLLNPLSQSIYPRLCRLIATDRPRAASLARVSLAVMAFAGVVMCVGILVTAPLLIRIGLGPGYEQAIPALRILSLLIPLVAVSNVLGIQWMLPLRMDATFNQIILCAGLLNLALAMWWASRWQQIGMAAAVVISEFMVTAAMCVILARRNLSPFAPRDPTLSTSTV